MNHFLAASFVLIICVQSLPAMSQTFSLQKAVITTPSGDEIDTTSTTDIKVTGTLILEYPVIQYNIKACSQQETCEDVYAAGIVSDVNMFGREITLENKEGEKSTLKVISLNPTLIVEYEYTDNTIERTEWRAIEPSSNSDFPLQILDKELVRPVGYGIAKFVLKI